MSPEETITALEFLSLVAAMTCPCGHTAAEHGDPDPDWKVGDLREKFGACTVPGCGCKGVIE